MWNCFRCGHECIWQNDEMKSNFEGGDCSEDQDQMVSWYLCPNCGAMHEVWDPSFEDAKDYPAYQEK
jgi:acetone carboxylase gamma subunit